MSAPLSDCTDPDPDHLVLASQPRTGPPAPGEHAIPRPGKTEGGEEGEGGERREREGGRERGRTGSFWATAKLDYKQDKLTRTWRTDGHRYAHVRTNSVKSQMDFNQCVSTHTDST